LAVEAGDHHIDTWVTVLTARQRAREGGLDEAVSMQKKVIESLKLIPDYPVLVDSYGHLADCYLRRGDLPNAFAALAQADQWTARKSIFGHLMVFPPLVRIWANLARAEQSDERGRLASLRGQSCMQQRTQTRPGLPWGRSPGALRAWFAEMD
jgi:hypothetical protein